MKKTNDILVIGGGPAGMMAAIAAARSSRNITLLEKNDTLGKKLLLTGNGRCNMTNTSGLNTFLEKFHDNGPFLRDAFRTFFSTDLISFFEARGLKCKKDPENRVFPVTDKASGVLSVLEKELAENGITVIYNSAVTGITTREGRVTGIKLKNGNSISAGSVILATGGASYPSTGSSGDGYVIAAATGHILVPVHPGLVPVIIKESWLPRLAGLSLSKPALTVRAGNKTVLKKRGDILFTPKGLSGPAALSSGGIIHTLCRKHPEVTLKIDTMPDMEKKTSKRIYVP